MTDQFDPQFVKQEQEFRKRAERLHKMEREARAKIRADVGADDDTRQTRYMKRWQELNEEFERMANEHGKWFYDTQRALDEKIHKGTGEKFSEHLTALANTSDEKLPELLSTAQRTGQKDLARAVAQTALERRQLGIFQTWADSEPELAEALKRRRSLPEDKRFLDRTLTMRPFKADMTSLTPTPEDHDRAAREETAAEAQKRQFFGFPRRQVGSRVYPAS
jgi:hypothetical protein